MKTTIAIVANTAWNLHNFRLGLIRALVAAGYRVLAVAPPDEFADSLLNAGAEFVPLRRLSRKGTNPISDWLLLRELRRIYRQNKVAVALQYTIKPNIYGTLAAAGCGTRTVCTVTGLGYSFLNAGWINRLVKFLYKRAFRKADAVAFQNGDDRQLFLDLGLVRADKTLLIKGSGINTDYFKAQAFRRDDERFTFLFVGRLLYDKGICELLQAARRLHEQAPGRVRIQIVGAIDQDNPSAVRPEEVQALHRAGIVEYLGQSNEVRDIMNRADAVVLPSYREGIPRVLLEALSMSKPVVTTDAPGCRETVTEGENGFLVPVKDAQALGEAMLRLLRLTEEERQKMGEKGRERALKEFDEKAIIGTYLQLIARLQ